MPSLIDLVNQYREDLLNNDVRAMSRLARAYSASYKSLLLEVNKLTKIVESGTYTASQVHRLTRYKTTVAQVAGELSRMQALTIEEVNAAANIGIKLGDAHARGLIAATVGSEQLAIAFNKLDPQLTRALLGFLDPNGQLYQRMNELSNFNADLISQNLTDGIIKGFNPQKIARMFTSGWGMALADSMRMVRTAQLYSYREASRATYLANSGVVQQWQWSAFHSPSTCMSCIVMDGSLHPTTETLNDHYNGRAEISGNIILADNITAFETLRYNGDIIVINTASNKFLAITPNHPVLTRRGWVAAKFIQIGDDVISNDGGLELTTVVNPNKQHVPSCVEDIPSTFNMLRLGLVPGPTKYFNSENGIDGQVDVIFINRLLWNSYNASLREPVGEHNFCFGSSKTRYLSSYRSLAHSFMRSGFTPNSIMSIFYNLFPLFRCHSLETEGISFGTGMSENIGLSQYASNYTAGYSKGTSQLQFRLPSNITTNNIARRQSDFIPTINGYFTAFNRTSFGGPPEQPLSLERIRETLLSSMPACSTNFRTITGQIIFDRVIEINIRTFSGHVYSLQTPQEWYYSNGIISHNCAMIPVVKGFPPAIDKGSGQSWFKGQTPEIQKQMMGAKKWDAWKAGKFDLEDISKMVDDPVYGAMRVEASLKDLVSK